jgi:hypothetical protein
LRLYLETLITKQKAAGVAQGVGPEFKPKYCKKKKKKKIYIYIYIYKRAGGVA